MFIFCFNIIIDIVKFQVEEREAIDESKLPGWVRNHFRSYELELILTSLLEAVLRVGVCEGALFEKVAP